MLRNRQLVSRRYTAVIAFAVVVAVVLGFVVWKWEFAEASGLRVEAPSSCLVVGCVGDEVDTSTGAYRTAAEDLIFPPGLFGVELIRTYRSDDAEHRLFGRGWVTVYDTRIREEDGTFVLDAPAGFQPMWAPEAPEGWRIEGTPAVEAADDGHVLTWPSGEAWMFDDDGALIELESPDGATVSIERSGEHTITVSSSQGVVLTMQLEDDLVREVTTSGDRTVTYHYDDLGQLAMVEAPGETFTYSYREGVMTTAATSIGVTTLDYTDDGQVAVQELPSGERFEFDYAPGSTTVADDRTTTAYHHDADGRLTEATRGGNQILSITYDIDGRLANRQEFALPSGDVVSDIAFEYSNGRLHSITEDGVETTFSYDERGRVTEVGGPTAATFSYAAEHALPVAVETPGSGRTEFMRVDGFVVGVTDATGVTTTTRRDDLGNVVVVEGSDATTWTYEFDAEGNVTSTTSPSGRRWTAGWAPRRRLLRERDPLDRVTTYHYDDAGRLTEQRQPGGRAESRRFAKAGLLESETRPGGATTDYAYSHDGRLASVTIQGDRTWRIGYDDAGDGSLTTTVTAPDGSRTVTETDSAGRQVKRQTLAVDDQLIEEASMSYEFGRITTTHVWRWRHHERDDVVSSLTAELDDQPSSELVTTAAYDELGRLESRQAEVDGSPLSSEHYQYTNRRPESVTIDQMSTSYEYDEAGRLTGIVDEDGVRRAEYQDGRLHATVVDGDRTEVLDWDDDGRPLKVGLANGSDVTWQYDDAGRPTARNVGDEQAVFVWNDRDELERYRSAASTWEWTYDDAGRILTELEPGGVTTEYEYGDDRVIRTTSAAESNRTDEFMFNDQGLLSEASTASGHYEYSYDATGHVIEVGGDGDEDWMLDAAGRVVEVATDGKRFEIGYSDDGRLDSVQNLDERGVRLDVERRDGLVQSIQLTDEEPSNIEVDDDGRLVSATLSGEPVAEVDWTDTGFTVTDPSTDEKHTYTLDDGVLTAFANAGKELVSRVPESDGAGEWFASSPDVDLEAIDLGEPGWDPVRAADRLYVESGTSDEFQVQPDPFAQIAEAAATAVPAVVSPIGVDDLGHLGEQLFAAQLTELQPEVSLDGVHDVAVPVFDFGTGGLPDFNPVREAAARSAIDVVDPPDGGGTPWYRRPLDAVSAAGGAVYSAIAATARFVADNPLVVAGVVVGVGAGVACGATAGLLCAGLVVTAGGLGLVGLASAVPSAISGCRSGIDVGCALGVGYVAVAVAELTFVARLGVGMGKVALRASQTRLASGVHRSIASGRLGVARSELAIAARGGRVAAREVPVCIKGTCARLDLVQRTWRGRLVPVEVKNGAAARFTTNQRTVYPMLRDTKAYLPNGLLNNGAATTMDVGNLQVDHWGAVRQLQVP